MEELSECLKTICITCQTTRQHHHHHHYDQHHQNRKYLLEATHGSRLVQTLAGEFMTVVNQHVLLPPVCHCSLEELLGINLGTTQEVIPNPVPGIFSGIAGSGFQSYLAQWMSHHIITTKDSQKKEKKQ